MVSNTVRTSILPLLLISIIVLAIFWCYWNYAATIVLAATLAVVLAPVYERLSRKIPERRAASVVILVVMVLLLVIFSFVVSVSMDFSGYLMSMSATIYSWIHTLPSLGFFRATHAATTFSVLTNVIQATMVGAAILIPAFFLHAFIFFLSLFLFLLKGPAHVAEILDSIPDHLKETAHQLKNDVVNTLYAVYVVNLQIAIITFAIALPFYTLIGAGAGAIPNATLTAVSQVIPTFGPFLVLLFLGMYALALGNLNLAVLICIVGCILFLVIPGTVLRPRMMGRRVSLPSPLMMIAILGGVTTFGLAGIIIGPLCGALLVSSYRMFITQMKVMKEGTG